MVMAVITFLLIVSVTIVWIPKRKETFIYEFDQTMSLFDNKGNFESFEINVQIVFPENEKLRQKMFWDKVIKERSSQPAGTATAVRKTNPSKR